MEINNLYESHITDLFSINFEDVLKKYSKNLDQYNWSNIKSIFIDFYKKLSDINISETDFIKYYYIFTFLYLQYTNFLKFSKNNDFNNQEIYKIINKIKLNTNIVNNLFKYSHNSKVKKIIKLSNIFILKSINNNKFKDSKYVSNLLNDYIKNIKQLEKISNIPNNNFKKIFNIVIYRYVSSKSYRLNNYHEFFSQKITNFSQTNNIINFNDFIDSIPNSKKLLDIITSKKSNPINIDIKKIINFFITKSSNKLYITKTNTNDSICLSNKKYGGIIKINIINGLDNIEFNNYQSNLSLINFNIQEINDYHFLKNSKSFIEINIENNIISDISSLLHIIHLLTISIKMLESFPNDLYEFIYPIEYTNYYFVSFCNFLEFIKPEINKNYAYNKFILDIFKYLFIYSYYDYYFYYSNKFMETVMNNFEYKNFIFEQFTTNLKNVLKLPKELNQYPPFLNFEDDDINSIIYYNFEIPSYFKFFDFMNAFTYVFDKRFYVNKKFDLTSIIVKYIDFNNKNLFIVQDILKKSEINITSKSSSSEVITSSKSTSSNDEEQISSTEDNEIESRLDTEIIKVMSKDDKKLMNNNNTYIELDIKNDFDCLLITDT
jgi:hypothetical protein